MQQVYDFFLADCVAVCQVGSQLAPGEWKVSASNLKSDFECQALAI